MLILVYFNNNNNNLIIFLCKNLVSLNFFVNTVQAFIFFLRHVFKLCSFLLWYYSFCFCVVLLHIIHILKRYSLVLEGNGLSLVDINQFYLSPIRITFSYLKTWEIFMFIIPVNFLILCCL